MPLSRYLRNCNLVNGITLNLRNKIKYNKNEILRRDILLSPSNLAQYEVYNAVLQGKLFFLSVLRSIGRDF